MRDDFYQWLLFVLPIVLGAVLGLWTKRFETPRYRWAAVIFCVLFSAGAYVEMRHESRKAAADRDKAIKETAKQYADTVASQALKIGELEGYIQSQGNDVRDVKKYTVANTAQLHALREETQTGKQKRQDVKDRINNYVKASNLVLGDCRSAGPQGSGGTSPAQCTLAAMRWRFEATGYIAGSLGESYVNRFVKAVFPTNPGESVSQSSLDSRLDPETASQIYSSMRDLEAEVVVLKDFVKELGE